MVYRCPGMFGCLSAHYLSGFPPLTLFIQRWVGIPLMDLDLKECYWTCRSKVNVPAKLCEGVAAFIQAFFASSKTLIPMQKQAGAELVVPRSLAVSASAGLIKSTSCCWASGSYSQRPRGQRSVFCERLVWLSYSRSCGGCSTERTSNNRSNCQRLRSMAWWHTENPPTHKSLWAASFWRSRSAPNRAPQSAQQQKHPIRFIRGVQLKGNSTLKRLWEHDQKPTFRESLNPNIHVK